MIETLQPNISTPNKICERFEPILKNITSFAVICATDESKGTLEDKSVIKQLYRYKLVMFHFFLLKKMFSSIYDTQNQSHF